MTGVLHFVDEALFFCTSVSSIYLFALAVSSQMRRSGKYPKKTNKNRYAVLVKKGTPPLALDYPEELYTLLPGDDFAQTVAALDASHFNAVVVLGETEEVSPNFLDEINNAFDGGARFIQLHHVIQPRLTLAEKFQANSEEIANALFKQGHTGMGLSSSLDGTDMVLELAWLQKNLKSARTNLESRLNKQNHFIEYLGYVSVYSTSKRTRQYLLSRSKAIRKLPEALLSGQWNYTAQLLQRFVPSWTLLLPLCTLLAVCCTCIDWSCSLKWWGAVLFLLFTVCLAIPDYLVEKKKKSKKRNHGK